jgi:hypothetical protein
MDSAEMSDLEALFERAVVSEDEAYERVEAHLRQAGEEAAPVLRRNLDHADAIGQLAARVLLEWSESGGDDFDKASRYLELLPARFAGTAARTPPVRGVLHNLSARYGGRLAEFLALRLVKQSQPANWEVLTSLAYLDQYKNPAVTEALIRFAARTTQPQWQQLATRVLRDLGDPALAAKLTAERGRLAQNGRSLPPALLALA